MEYFTPHYSERDAIQYSPLVLAYIGDAVYELIIRLSVLPDYASSSAKQLHQQTTETVQASSQAALLGKLTPMLTTTEQNVVRRAKNVKVQNPPKGADLHEYRYATALEALIGYLYLTGQTNRIWELIG